MRKLLLLGALGAVFGSALLLEHLFSKPPSTTAVADNQAVLRIGGGPPQSIPEAAPTDAVEGRDPPKAPKEGAGTSRGKDSDRDRRALAREHDGSDGGQSPASERFHEVLAKETLSSIARDELGSAARWKELAAWNGIDDPSALKSGVKLRLAPPVAAAPAEATPAKPATSRPPADEPRTHKVSKGETLSKIAALYLGDAGRWREIQRLNSITDPAILAEGTTLAIPAR